MNRLLLFLAVIIFCADVDAQTPFVHEKRDNIWLMGFGGNADSTTGGTKIDFTLGDPNFLYQHRELDFDFTNASICDQNGDLLFYTNGISVANGNHEIIENGDILIDSELTDDWSGSGYRLPQGALFLPKPGNGDIFSLFQIEMEYGDFQNNGFIAPRLHYFEIDKNANNSQGAVTLNEVLVIDTLAFGHLTATKHANGVDWWVLCPEASSNRFYTLLLTENGVIQNQIQEVGDTSRAGVGHAVFSPDGTKYARANSIGINSDGILEAYLDFYEFDRCTGMLSSHQQISGITFRGVSFSANSAYLYATNSNRIFQIATNTTNIGASLDTVAIYDGFETPTEFPIRTLFRFSQLAPNNKIYISTPGSNTSYMHVINQPNLQGEACDVTQHSILLPIRNNTDVSNYPYFRLGALEGSSCDTMRPVAQFSYQTNNLTIQFQDESLRTPTKWFWTFGDGETSDLQQPVHNYANLNTYEVCLKVTNEAGSDRTCQTIDLIVSVKETDISNQISFSPNPTKGNILLSLPEQRVEGWELNIYDATGKQVLSRVIKGFENNINLSLGDFPSGIYMYKIVENGLLLKSGKIVKQ